MTGVNIITYYSPRIFATLGIQSTDLKLFATGFYGVAKTVGMIIFSFWVADHLGRRKGLIWGAFLGAVPMVSPHMSLPVLSNLTRKTALYRRLCHENRSRGSILSRKDQHVWLGLSGHGLRLPLRRYLLRHLARHHLAILLGDLSSLPQITLHGPDDRRRATLVICRLPFDTLHDL